MAVHTRIPSCSPKSEGPVSSCSAESEGQAHTRSPVFPRV